MSAELTLEAYLAAASARLTETVMVEVYADPFWHERFGNRGRRHADRDGDYHVEYLVQALAARDQRLFVSYALWLREVLVSRGMCSRHLADTFERLAKAIDRQPWAERDRATAILAAGVDALVYRDGDAGHIDATRTEIAERVADALGAFHASWSSAWPAAGRARYLADALDHLSYLADALAFDASERLAGHVRFVDAFLRRHGAPADYLRRLLDELQRAVDSVVRVRDASDRPSAHLAAACLAIDTKGAS